MTFMTAMAEAEPVNIYVSADGSDSGNGTKEKPFATLQKAQEAARKALVNSTVTVNVGEGEFYLEQPLMLTDADSGQNGNKMIYKGSGNTLISGGIKSDEKWQQHDGNIYKMSIPESFGDRYISSLYINGEQKQRAKTETRVSADGRYEVERNGQKRSEGFVFSDERLANLNDYEDIELGWSWQWRYVILPVLNGKSLENGKTALYFKQPDFNLADALNNFDMNGYVEFDAFNSYSFMDSPGEFYYDRKAHTLYYFKSDGENLDDCKTVIPNLDRVLDISGADSLHHASDIEISGFMFSHTVSDDRTREYIHDPHQANMVEDMCFEEEYAYPLQAMGVRHGIRLSHAENILFTDNEVCRMQGGGVGIYDDVVNCDISGNAFYELASNAVSAGLLIHEYSSVEKDGLTNISARKPMTSSTTLSGSDSRGSSLRLTHGDYTNNVYDSGNESRPWVQVDLGEAHRIKNVILVPHYSSSTLAATRINIDILGSNDPNFAQYEILGRQGDNIGEFPLNGYLNKEINDPAKYRYIRIAKKDRAVLVQVIVLTDDMGGIKTTAPTKDCRISNNYINDVCQFYRGAVPLEIYYVSGYEVTHNEIYNAPYTAIQMGWGWARGKCDFAGNNTIAYNRLENVMTRLADGGHIYLLGPQPNSKIYRNYTNGAQYFSGGIYPDNGSAGWEIYENVCERSSFSLHPWAADSGDMQIHNNYVSSPRYKLGASNTYIKNGEVFIRNNPPEYAQAVIDESGLENPYKQLKDKYTSSTSFRWIERQKPVLEEFPVARATSLYDGLISEAKTIITILKNESLSENAEAIKFIADFNAIVERSNADGKTDEDVINIWHDLDELIESFTKTDIFKNGYNTLKYSDGLPIDDSTVPIVKNGTVKGNIFVNDSDSFRIPITADSEVNTAEKYLKMTNMGVKNIYYTSAKFGDVMFEFDFKYKYVSGDFSGFVLRGKDPTTYMETKGNCGYSFNFGDKKLDIQRFNSGARTVIYGDVEGQNPLSGVKTLSVPISYADMNHVKVGAFNVENGVRLYLEINGEKIIDFVDETDGRIEDAGYFSFLAPFTEVTVGAGDDAVYFNDTENEKWANMYIYLLAENGIINGMGNGIYAPAEEVTYDDFMRLVTRTFPSVSKEDLSLKLPKIPNGILSREDAAVILYNALNKSGANVDEKREIAFSTENIADYAVQAAEMLGKMGLLSGDEHGNFNPKNGITRAQCAKLIFLSMQYAE